MKGLNKKILLALGIFTLFSSNITAADVTPKSFPEEEVVHGVTIKFAPIGDFAEPNLKNHLSWARTAYITFLEQFVEDRKQCNMMLQIVKEINALLMFAGVQHATPMPEDEDLQFLQDFSEQNTTVDFGYVVGYSSAFSDMEAKSKRSKALRSNIQNSILFPLIESLQTEKQKVVEAFQVKSDKVTAELQAMLSRHVA